MTNFDAAFEAQETIKWIREWFLANGPRCKAVVGMSGGKDSTVVAKLLCEALGPERVIGVIMPNGDMPDLGLAMKICKEFQMPFIIMGIEGAYNAIASEYSLRYPNPQLSEQAKINLPARLRMVTLYAVSQSMNGRVVNTCNLSEDWVGYSTRYGDSAGDFAPIAGFLTDEVIAIGQALGIPDEWIFKTPSDGLCGKSDEDNLGFTYAVLNDYIRTGVCDDPNVKARIDQMHIQNMFKMMPMSAYHPLREARALHYPW